MRNELFLRDPFLRWARELAPWTTDFDEVLGGVAAPNRDNVLKNFDVSCDIEETPNHYLFTFDVPGIRKEDIKIEFHEGQLLVSGERKTEETENRSHLKERFYGTFKRSFKLPATVRMDGIEASYDNGVLMVAVPKAEEARPQQIKINEGKSGFFEKLGLKKEKDVTEKH